MAISRQAATAAVILMTAISGCGGGDSSSLDGSSSDLTPAPPPISESNVAPSANAGVAQALIAGGVVTLDGTASADANGDALTYSWTLASIPAGSVAVLSDARSSTPSFTVDKAGSYEATLIVNDGLLSSAPVTVMVSAKSIPFTTLTGFWENGIADHPVFPSDSTTLTVSVASGVLTIRNEQFFDGTCIYTANLTPDGDGVGPGTFQCSDFSTGEWQLQDMQRVDSGDRYIRLTTLGSGVERIYGMLPSGQVDVQVLPAPIASLEGRYDGIGTGGPFGTESTDVVVSVSGSTLTLTMERFFSGTCEYSATIAADGRTLTNASFKCSDFSTGTWSLLDMRGVGTDDVYVSLLAEGELRRAYGWR